MKKSVKRSLDAYIRQMDRIDLRVIACVILLSVFGLIMIYSASAYSCSTLAKYNYDSLYLLKKQGIFVLAGIVVMLLLQYFNYNYLQKLAPIIFLVSVGSLFLLKRGLLYALMVQRAGSAWDRFNCRLPNWLRLRWSS